MNAFKNLSIRGKITAVIIVLCAVGILVLLVSLSSLRHVNTELNRLVEVEAEKVRLGARINRNLAEIRIAEKNLIAVSTREEARGFAQGIRESKNDLQERLSELEQLVDEEGRSQAYLSHRKTKVKRLREWK